MPFKIEISFDRSFIGNTFLREDVFRKSPNRLFIGILDFDEAFENWERLKTSKGSDSLDRWEFVETDCQKGLQLKHKKYIGYIFLLPVPNERQEYASLQFGKKSKLSLELLFTELRSRRKSSWWRKIKDYPRWQENTFRSNYKRFFHSRFH